VPFFYLHSMPAIFPSLVTQVRGSSRDSVHSSTATQRIVAMVPAAVPHAHAPGSL
jgi:hypothetical protein